MGSVPPFFIFDRTAKEMLYFSLELEKQLKTCWVYTALHILICLCLRVCDPHKLQDECGGHRAPYWIESDLSFERVGAWNKV